MEETKKIKKPSKESLKAELGNSRDTGREASKEKFTLSKEEKGSNKGRGKEGQIPSIAYSTPPLHF